MLLTYPALIYFTVEEEDSPYFVHFPDFENSATQGHPTLLKMYTNLFFIVYHELQSL